MRHRLSSGRPLSLLGDSGVLASLKTLVHDDRGIRNAQLLEDQDELLALPAVRQRLALQDPRLPLGHRARSAITVLIDDLQRFGGATQLTASQLEAVQVLLYIPNTVRVHDQQETRPLDKGHSRRADVACDILRTSRSEFRQVRRSKAALRRRTPEEKLLEDFLAAVSALDAPPSVSRPYRLTPVTGGSAGPPDDLVGTWDGATESAWLLKHTGTDRAGIVRSFMVVELHDSQLIVRWLYRHGTTVAVAVRLTDTDEGRRLLCLYEATVPFEDTSREPSHRGACLLDIKGDREMWTGPYWTDRSTHGTLTFTRRVRDRFAETFEEAEALFA